MIMQLRSLLLLLSIFSGAALCQELAPPPFQSGAVVLLQPDAELGERLSGGVESLATYMKVLFGTLEEEADRYSHDEPTTGVLVVAVRPEGRSRIWLEFGDNPKPEPLLAALKDKLLAIKPPPVRGGPISFSVEFQLWGGSSPLTSREQPFYAPLEWREAVGRMGKPADTETVLDAVWPDEG